MAIEEVILVKPRGFCAGVEMAIETVERALTRHGPPLYVFHEIVHNQHVVADFAKRGVCFVQSIDAVPAGARLVFSAHGVAPEVWQRAKQQRLQVIIDATCPLVEKVHREVRKFAGQGYWIVLVGHQNHDEIVGTSGEAPERIRVVANADEAARLVIPEPERIVALTQTTLSVDDTREIIAVLKGRFPKLITAAKDDICYATQNRQDAVKQLSKAVDLVLVIGSRNSENSNQLRRVALAQGKDAYLIDDQHGIDPAWLQGVKIVGITSGASVPERLVQQVADYFTQLGAAVSYLGVVEENIHFALPAEILTVP